MDINLSQWKRKLEKSNELDLSRDEDMSIALMNLVSLEEHFFFTAMKTNDGKYLDMLTQVRKIRTTMLATIVKNTKGEEWCISKHLLAASMRLYEVGTKELGQGKDAQNYFESSFELWSLFFGINLGLVESKPLLVEQNEKTKITKMSEMLKKVVNCCKEW